MCPGNGSAAGMRPVASQITRSALAAMSALASGDCVGIIGRFRWRCDKAPEIFTVSFAGAHQIDHLVKTGLCGSLRGQRSPKVVENGDNRHIPP